MGGMRKVSFLTAAMAFIFATSAVFLVALGWVTSVRGVWFVGAVATTSALAGWTGARAWIGGAAGRAMDRQLASWTTVVEVIYEWLQATDATTEQLQNLRATIEASLTRDSAIATRVVERLR
jgi:hypothetical protein